MPESPAKHGVARGSVTSGLKVLGRFLSRLLLRGYALALIALIAYLSYSAIRYLVDSLIVPATTPRQIAELPRRMDEALIHGSQPDWLGLRAVENPRAPLDHYHRFDTWIEPDRFNDCTRSGCHSPLPHADRKETRAFLNMHATSIHCAVCHFDEAAKPLPLTWYDLRTARVGDPPPLLRAYDWLTQRSGQVQFSRDDQAAIVRLIRAAAGAAHDDATLLRIAQNLEGYRPGGENFLQALRDATDAVRHLFRGSYGAKLALRYPGGEPVFGHANTHSAVRDWLTRGSAAQGEERDRLLKAVHPRRRIEARHCSECHVESGGLVDFESLGYPPSRAFMLHNSPVFRMIEHIGEGRPFYLPGFGVPAGSAEGGDSGR